MRSEPKITSHLAFNDGCPAQSGQSVVLSEYGKEQRLKAYIAARTQGVIDSVPMDASLLRIRWNGKQNAETMFVGNVEPTKGPQ